MFRYSTIYINTISFVISIIIFSIVQLTLFEYQVLTSKSYFKAGFESKNIITEELIKEETKEISEQWYVEIPTISLKAEINEGTTKEIMDEYVGHFEETSKEKGNVGLAAHNRGYPKNYFENIKKLKEGDIIFYQYKDHKRKYEVTKNIIIQDTDWSNLEETEENKITLITCVENEPQYRRCIQGIEMEEF